jgi:hypothetical protein
MQKTQPQELTLSVRRTGPVRKLVNDARIYECTRSGQKHGWPSIHFSDRLGGDVPADQDVARLGKASWSRPSPEPAVYLHCTKQQPPGRGVPLRRHQARRTPGASAFGWSLTAGDVSRPWGRRIAEDYRRGRSPPPAVRGEASDRSFGLAPRSRSGWRPDVYPYGCSGREPREAGEPSSRTAVFGQLPSRGPTRQATLLLRVRDTPLASYPEDNLMGESARLPRGNRTAGERPTPSIEGAQGRRRSRSSAAAFQSADPRHLRGHDPSRGPSRDTYPRVRGRVGTRGSRRRGAPRSGEQSAFPLPSKGEPGGSRPLAGLQSLALAPDRRGARGDRPAPVRGPASRIPLRLSTPSLVVDLPLSWVVRICLVSPCSPPVLLLPA